MGAGRPEHVIRGTGRIVIDPTEEFDGGTFPYGGTEIGYANACQWQPIGGEPYAVTYESTGRTGDILEPPDRILWGCFLRGHDDDAIETLLPLSVEDGSVSQHAVISIPGDRVAGASALSRAVVLAYIPDDPLHVDGVVLYRAVPYWAPGARIAFERRSEIGLPLTFEAVEDASGRILKMGRIYDLTLA